MRRNQEKLAVLSNIKQSHLEHKIELNGDNAELILDDPEVARDILENINAKND